MSNIERRVLMYKISIPIMNQNLARAGRDRLTELLEKMIFKNKFGISAVEYRKRNGGKTE